MAFTLLMCYLNNNNEEEKEAATKKSVACKPETPSGFYRKSVPILEFTAAKT